MTRSAEDEDEDWCTWSPWLDLDTTEPATIEVDHDEDASAPWILFGPDGETIISQTWQPIGFARAITP